MTLNLREKGDRWRYSGCGCRTEVELRKDTWLDNKHLRFRKVALFIYCWSKELKSNTHVFDAVTCVKFVLLTF